MVPTDFGLIHADADVLVATWFHETQTLKHVLESRDGTLPWNDRLIHEVSISKTISQ